MGREERDIDYIYTTLINKFIIIFCHRLTRDFYLSLFASVCVRSSLCALLLLVLSLFFFFLSFFFIVFVLLLLFLLAFTLVRNFVICLHDPIANSATNRTLPISQNIITRSLAICAWIPIRRWAGQCYSCAARSIIGGPRRRNKAEGRRQIYSCLSVLPFWHPHSHSHIASVAFGQLLQSVTVIFRNSPLYNTIHKHVRLDDLRAASTHGCKCATAHRALLSRKCLALNSIDKIQ